MFKTNEEIIIIQAKAATPIPTGVVFWSHDKGTAKMLFQLQKDYVNQTLSEGTIVPICLDFVGGRHIYHAIIEDAINGIVSIVLEDNILGYVGRVTGSIYIELPDSRSLDTAGRFTFDIKRSPIDLNTPELEDYYWQGFGEIMEQYHESIAEIKSEAKALLDSLTADVTTAKTKVTQLEQSITTANTNLNARIDEINKKIDDNDVLTKAESSANVIYQVIGKEKVRLTFVLDFKNKIADSTVENPNIFSWTTGSTLQKPSSFVVKPDQNSYDKVSSLDNVSQLILQNKNGTITQAGAFWDLLKIMKDELGEQFFITRGAVDLNSQIEILRKETILQWNVWGKGSGPSGNRLVVSAWSMGANGWAGDTSTTSNSITKIGNKTVASNNKHFIDNDGFVNITAYAEAADGTTYSSISIDYANLEVSLEISMNEHIKSMMAANHVGNLATQEEAETGTDNAKAMTPLRTAQQINKKAVTIAGNQTIGGIKNFKDGLMINDVSLSTITRKVIYEADGVGGYFNAADKFTLGASGKIDKIVLLWSRVDDTAGTLLNYSWSQTVLSPDDLVVGNSYRIQMTTDNYKFVTFANESGNVTIYGANENSVAPNRIYRIKRIIAYLKN
ncbi:phage baseplate upper protein [Enterococcus avium]|uniref:BppU family phage baseplate upper protein n=1 Tax=Enterococcus avium TaxID=33945 RepID=UPI001D089787|nr:BppU family phage baseplate upper protein [Enterococcus avium]MCB6917320.1 phage baseplate upper protein [Enterococcus avium]MCQ4961032.1 phage baseplate upper protein [Enterococcus avium]